MLDCKRNSITNLSLQNFSPKQLHRVNSNQKKELLLEKNINWDDYPEEFKFGSFVKKRKITKEGKNPQTGEISQAERTEIVWGGSFSILGTTFSDTSIKLLFAKIITLEDFPTIYHKFQQAPKDYIL